MLVSTERKEMIGENNGQVISRGQVGNFWHKSYKKPPNISFEASCVILALVSFLTCERWFEKLAVGLSFELLRYKSW